MNEYGKGCLPNFIAMALALLAWHRPVARAAETYVPFAGARSTWHDGFERHDFLMNETNFAITPFQRPDGEDFAVGPPPKGQRRCIVVVPKQAAPGHPWSWQACYWDHEPQTEVELLRRGFHIAFITPDPGQPWDAWYTYLTEQHGLSQKPAFVGMSRGGINEYDWTAANPTKVSCIYADNPAIRPETFAKLGGLARHGVALLNICGSQDSLLQRNTIPIEDRYQQLGGQITVMIKDGPAHHPHSLRNPRPIADWIEQHLLPASTTNRPAFADDTYIKSYYYSLDRTNVYLQEENTYANCRGPGFTPCYDRYDAKTQSEWGKTGLTIIVPTTNAPGKPWVFRADAIGRDALIDQALLARGFHIVIPPLTEQSGPVSTQWNNAYQLLVDHGFSRKPVMEGTGTAAGEAYAWAIEHADKVACILGRNPALRSLMSKTPPLDNLVVLAKAGVPLVHVCDRDDPWFNEQTRVVEQRYKELGGRITVIINEGDGPRSFASPERTRAIDLIVAKANSK
ncbi:MAG TPA: alpha/beta hydrolase [Verrucomicrobiae bacterium]|nr:alpha/beta hydrolase [Verrucomicrobiae bacterium]